MSYQNLVEYIRELVNSHRHAAGEGNTPIKSDSIIASLVQHPFPAFRLRSRQQIQRLNAEYWGGHKVGEQIRLVVERFPTLALRPAFGNQGRLVYVDATHLVYVDTGIAWANVGAAVAHHASHETGGDDVVALSRANMSDFFDADFWINIPDKPSTFAPASHGDEAHTGSIIPDDDQDFQENEALAFRVENVADLPEAGHAGRVVFLLSDGKIYVDTGSAWVAW